MAGHVSISAAFPTKTTVHDAELQHDFAAAMQRKASVVSFLRDKNFHNLADLENVDVIEGRAEFIDNHTVRVVQPTGEIELSGEKIFINTGAQATMPNVAGLMTTPGVFDSTGLLNLTQRPERLGFWAAVILVLNSHQCLPTLAVRSPFMKPPHCF